MMAPKELFTTSSNEMLIFKEGSLEFFFTVVANVKLLRIFQIVSADQNFVRGVASLPVIITVDTVHTSHFAIARILTRSIIVMLVAPPPLRNRATYMLEQTGSTARLELNYSAL